MNESCEKTRCKIWCQSFLFFFFFLGMDSKSYNVISQSQRSFKSPLMMDDDLATSWLSKDAKFSRIWNNVPMLRYVAMSLRSNLFSRSFFCREFWKNILSKILSLPDPSNFKRASPSFLDDVKYICIYMYICTWLETGSNLSGFSFRTRKSRLSSSSSTKKVRSRLKNPSSAFTRVAECRIIAG